MENVYLAIVLAPLIGSIVAGLLGHRIGRAGAHWAAIIGVSISFVLSLIVFKDVVVDGAEPFNGAVYTWMVVEGIRFEIGFLVDSLTALMILVVSFVSLMVHIYTIGYMADDPGYQRFFSYIALFTFSMLMLVMSNNFLQLFFGWEAVGLVSYLLIGFWYTKPTAIFASLKAFLVNRVGDFGFLLGIAAIVMYFNSLDYADVFRAAPLVSDVTLSVIPGSEWSVITLICILLFIGAMGKSAQVPLHVWLPDSMEGPTPISALIHAATMVTAGIFMVARMSPLFELSTTALSFVLVIGAISTFFMGLVGMIQTDIKRVIAYSTLSQLGYMTIGLGASAYPAAIFHLMTHACFKALLFLCAGSVIMGMHHDQDIRNMGGIRKYMPVTWITFLVGGLALSGIPGFAGFYSKDSIIEAAHLSTIPGAEIAYYSALFSVFVTGFYTFRLYFVVFHGKERMNDHTRKHLRETPWVVTVPLSLLAIPSVFLGYFAIEPLLFGGFFDDAIYIAPEHDVLRQLGSQFHGPLQFTLHGFLTPACWLAFSAIALTFVMYMLRPRLPDLFQRRLSIPYRILDRKYGFDDFNQAFFAAGSRLLGRGLWKYGDAGLIDGVIVNGSAIAVGWMSGVARRVQSGYLYHYAFAMIIGLLGLLTWVLARN